MGVIPEIGSFWTNKPTKRGCHLIKVVKYEERNGLKTVCIERLKSTTGGEPTRKRGRLNLYTLHATYQLVQEGS